MEFVIQQSEQIFLLFEGAMGVHCDREKEGKIPF